MMRKKTTITMKKREKLVKRIVLVAVVIDNTTGMITGVKG